MYESVYQRAVSNWVRERMGLHRVNGFMEFVIQNDENWAEDCVNLTRCEWLQDADLSTLQEFASDHGIELERDEDEDDDDYEERLRDEVCDSDAANEYDEVYEWYMTDAYTLLQRFGEVIYNGHDGPVWGRRTTGQAVYLDGVVQEIFKEYGYGWLVLECKESGVNPIEVANAHGVEVRR